MAERKIAGAYLKGCLRGIGLRIVVSMGVFLVLGCLVLFGASLSFFDIIDRDYVVVVVFGGFAVLTLLGGTGLGLFIILRRARRLDHVIEPLGLEGSHLSTAGRQFNGMLNGRRVHVALNRGPILDLYVEANTGTRLAIGESSLIGQALAERLNKKLLLLPEGFEDLHGSAHDHEWAQNLLGEPDVREAFQLLLDDNGPELRVLIIQPGAVLLRLQYIPLQVISTESMQRALDKLLLIAEQAEDLPTPAEPLEPATFDQHWLEDGTAATARRMNRAVWIGIGIGVGLIVCLSAAALALTAVLIMLDS